MRLTLPDIAHRKTRPGAARNTAWLVLAGLAVMISAAPVAGQTASRDYQFQDRISRDVLENYLSRSMTTAGLVHDQHADDLNAMLGMIDNTGVKFLGRSIFRWGGEASLPTLLKNAEPRIERIHKIDPQIIVQAAIFEIVSKEVEQLAVPPWVFEAFDKPVEDRHFDYEAMLFPDGTFVDHWWEGASVPDITQLETRMWVYYLARSYIDIGVEAIHFGQVALKDAHDEKLRHRRALLAKIRNYAADHARRGMLLADGHIPEGYTPVIDGQLVFDLHSFPLRLEEVKGKPEQAKLEVGHYDSIFGRSHGGTTYSGWECESLPYLVEFDNFAPSDSPGENIGKHYIWGYDEISWFAHQPQSERNEFLRYAWRWVEENAPAGHLQMPGMRVIHVPDEDRQFYRAYSKSRKVNGFGQEATIKAIWQQAPDN
jgi:hypothetical protein